jgi:hypothetical protein
MKTTLLVITLTVSFVGGVEMARWRLFDQQTPPTNPCLLVSGNKLVVPPEDTSDIHRREPFSGAEVVAPPASSHSSNLEIIVLDKASPMFLEELQRLL